MRKIQGLFVREGKGKLVSREVVPGSEWVLAGEGVATRKWDGSACLFHNGRLYKRYDAKVDPATLKPIRPAPVDFQPCQDPDPITGHWPGWIPVGNGPDDRWHQEALRSAGGSLPNGTYELCGPKVNSNRERFFHHCFIRHGRHRLLTAPRNFDAIRQYLESTAIEGIVWHHDDGRMVKVTREAFGFSWPVKRAS
jgi:hypothetical protein